MPKVHNKYAGTAQIQDVYIGRGSPWGNIYSALKPTPKGTIPVLTREESIRRYRDWIMADERADLRARARHELRGKDLVCFCKPAACHGDVLLEIANSEVVE